jgi:hypothetical protein
MILLTYRILLRFYPREHQHLFAEEMFSIFMQTAAESRAEGWRRYACFLIRECKGLLRGAWNERTDNQSVTPFLGGTVLAVLLQTAFYWAILNVLRGFTAAVEQVNLNPGDPLTASFTLGLWSVAVVICLLPLVLLLSIRLMQRRRRT